MASILLYAVFLSMVVASFAGDKVIRIIPGNSNELDFLSSLKGKQELKLDFWKAPHKPGLAVDVHVTDAAYKTVAKLLKEQNIKFQILIVDVDKLMDDENELQKRDLSFSFYSRYHPLNEIDDELRNLANQHAEMASVFNLGRSFEGRQQQAIKLRGRRKPGKKIFFMNCGIHAREWVSPATCMYIIKQIVSRYGRDNSVTEMLDKMDFVIMPVLNVDGYFFSWNTNNRKNRFWRKTRKPNEGSRCIGTDPNRNWNYMWGYPGASSNPCDDSYRGTHAFSEIEVKNVAEYLKTLNDNDQIAGYMDIHAYSQLWMTPWGYSTQKAKDYEELMRVSKAAVNTIQNAGYGTYYRYGPSSVVIYRNSGGSKDYTYGRLKIKYSFALELRDTGRYGFLLPAYQIVPTAMETFEGVKAMAREMKV